VVQNVDINVQNHYQNVDIKEGMSGLYYNSRKEGMYFKLFLFEVRRLHPGTEYHDIIVLCFSAVPDLFRILVTG
jgi:hypothetical protein